LRITDEHNMTKTVIKTTDEQTRIKILLNYIKNILKFNKIC